MANEINYTPVSDGFHDCKVVFAKRAEKHYGKEIKAHVVYELKLVAADCPEVDNPAAYKAEFPVVIVPGFEWDFFNEKTNKGEWRKATAADTKAVFDYAKKCFPEWAAYCDELPEGSDDLAFGWFADKDRVGSVTVRAKLVRGNPYTGSDGMEHEDLKAKIYAPFEAKPMLADGESRQIANALKAAGVKLFGKPKTAAQKSEGAKAAKPPAPPKPQKTVDQLRDEAFGKYQEFFADDKTGAGFYPKCAELIGKEIETWESWTADDWKKIARDLDMPF